MIRVFRQAAPDGHEGRAQAALAELTSAAQRNGGTPSRRDLQATYKDPDVRETLWRMQHGKCAYCEREIEVAWEPVEHYRPFATYWWLAYSWQNLLLACNSCNSAGKSDRFPLVDESKRLRPQAQPPGEERPLVLDPTSVKLADNPEQHLTFVEEPNGAWCIAPRDGSAAGSKSIEICDLGRSHLNRLRNKRVAHLTQLRARFERARQRDDAVELANCRGEKALLTGDNQPFALLARVILAGIT